MEEEFNMKHQIVLIRDYTVSCKIDIIILVLLQLIRFSKPVKTYNHVEVKFGKLTSGIVNSKSRIRYWITFISKLNKPDTVIYNLDLSPVELRRGEIYLNEVDGIEYNPISYWHYLIMAMPFRYIPSVVKRSLFPYEHVIRYLNATGKYVLDPYLDPVSFKKWADETLLKED